jgi:palmitoyltransferase
VFWGIFNTFAFLAWYSHLKSAFADPGIVSTHLVPPDGDKDIQMCEKCKPKQWKPMRAHHCRECNKCIMKMDHHCPWINSCLGIRNYKYFILFTAYTFLMSLVSGLNTVFCVLYLFLSGEIEQHLISIDKSSGISFILGIACFIEAILFAYFTFEMTYECCDVLESNQTYVDQLKNLTGIPMYFSEGV